MAYGLNKSVCKTDNDPNTEYLRLGKNLKVTVQTKVAHYYEPGLLCPRVSGHEVFSNGCDILAGEYCCLFFGNLAEELKIVFPLRQCRIKYYPNPKLYTLKKHIII